MPSIQSIPRWLKLSIIFPLLFLNGWLLLLFFRYLAPAPSIILTAALLAFLLDYPIAFLQERGSQRGAATALVILVALVVLVVVGFVLGPLLFQELVEFADRLPTWIQQGSEQIQALSERPALQRLPIDVDGIAIQATNQLTTTLRSFTSQLITFTLETINGTLNLVITIVLTILFVLNGDRLWDGLFSWLPDEWNTQVQTVLQQSFRGYFAGQAIIGSILGIALAIVFEFIQVPFGLLFGFAIGAASLIPFGGLLGIVLVSVLLSFQDVYLGLKVLIISVILGQINDNVVAPRLLSGITGLNPAVVIISLLVGVKVAGFFGLVLAVPTASFIKRVFDALRESGLDMKSIKLVDPSQEEAA